MNDPLFDEGIYKQYASKSTQELEEIIDDIDSEETKYLDMEARKDFLSNETNKIYYKVQELKEKQKKNEKKEREEKIIKLEKEYTSYKQEWEYIKKELDSSQKARVELMKIKHVIKKFILKGVTPILSHSKQEIGHPKIKQLRSLYKSHLRRWLSSVLSPEEIRNAEDDLNTANGEQQLKSIYDHYKQLAFSKGASTQALTAEEVERIQSDPREDVVPRIQAFARAKLSEKIRSNNIVMPKPPKYVSQSSSTAQTQTTAPHDAFKMKEKGSIKYLQPISPEKAEELETKIKTVQSVVILDPNRYKRRPYVVKSSR